MLSHRSIGIRTICLFWQVFFVTLGFWGWLFVWFNEVVDDRVLLERYLLYNEFLLVGILFGLGRTQEANGPHREWVLANRRSWRQALAGLFCVLLVEVAIQDRIISRSFLISYVPCLYLSLLFTNYWLPPALGQWAFSGDKEESVGLVGTVAQAIRFQGWLERKSLLGLRTIGIICPSSEPEAALKPALLQETYPFPSSIDSGTRRPLELGAPALSPPFSRATSGGAYRVSESAVIEPPLSAAITQVEPEPVRRHPSPFPVLGTLDEVGRILRERSITQLIALDLSLGPEFLRRLAAMTEQTGVRLLAVNDFNDYFGHTTATFEDDGVRFICLREEPLENPVNRVFKRLLDLAIALPMVVFVLPVAAGLVWLLQRWQSPGPVFLRQMRTGMLNRPFRMYKFRTMYVHNPDETKQAGKDDPRIYPSGRWLRRFSIDELPQFINVLRGDMSVVGPRPHLQQHELVFARVMRKYVVRRFIRPGITGWAQVNGYRGEVHEDGDIQKRVEADIHYLENWSLSLDCLIVLRTVRDCLMPPKSAY
jgi:lipopolysaccharide/colanic/teichoic acid biosynthesis glycosyltransferase